MHSIRYVAAIGIMSAFAAPATHADGFLGDQGKLLLTSGFSTIEGVGGAALAPWAVITGYGSNQSYGANAHYTDIELDDARLQSYGAAAGLFDRVEVSATRLNFDLRDALGSFHISEDIYGVKMKLFGDAVYSQNSWLPQVAVGAEYKKNDGITTVTTIPGLSVTRAEQLGAKDSNGVDFYLSATKIFLAQSFLVNATVLSTRANQIGLLGFGGDLKSDQSVEFAGSAAYLILRQLAVGGEYRSRPHNLGADDERGAWDAFIAWAPTRYVSLVAGFASIGTILAPISGDHSDHQGSYISLQIGF
jgi:hypothetical protein